MPKKTLVLFAHPSQERSEVNRHLAAAAAGIDSVTLVDLYAEYPSFEIDIDREQARLVAHDAIVFLHPMYWYSTPAILKEWQDLVLEYGFAYGAGGTALHGKLFLCALSAGGDADAYCAEGFNLFTIKQLLHPLEQTANLCGMIYVPPFILFGARSAADDGRLERHLSAWKALLRALGEDRLDIQAARRLQQLDADLPAFIKGS